MKNSISIVPFDAVLQKAASTFDCGSSVFYNHFIQSHEALDESFGKTFVCLTSDKSSIIGYYNIGAGEVVLEDGFQRLKCGGAIHINVFAIDKSYRGRKLATDDPDDIFWSELLLFDCMKRITKLREEPVGFAFITLSASKEGYNLYRKFGFTELDEDLYMSLSDIEKSGEGIQMYLPIDIE